MIIPRPPASINDTLIFQRLMSFPNDVDGLKAKVSRFIEVANPVVDSIVSGPFKNFTLHNRDHAKKLVHLAQYVASPGTIESLLPLECLLIIYASYIHDMGLAITAEETAKILASEPFADTLGAWPEMQQALDERREKLKTAKSEEKPSIEFEIADIHNAVLVQYLRPKHANRATYKSLIKRIRQATPGEDPFCIRGISFEEELIDICESHNSDSTVLGELKNAHEDRFQRRFVISDHKANLQFVAALLRLTDILDFDFERTPKILFESLGLRNRDLPGTEVTLKEWEKHLSVQQLEMQNTELIIKAQCAHPSIEAAVRQFCTIIENEIRETLSVVRRNEASIADQYQFLLPTNVRAEIRSQGYKFLNLVLHLDESAVMSLLMGTNLYRTPYAGVRELIQNSVDACVVREKLRPDLGAGSVQVSYEKDKDNRIWLCVKDNGIGMNEAILYKYFFRIGKSYYTSSEFTRLMRSAAVENLPLVSRFGIGFISVFMLADSIKIETRHVTPIISTHASVGLRVSVERLGALAYVQEDENLAYGTTIKMRIKPEFDQVEDMLEDGMKAEDILDSVEKYIKSTILRPNVPVSVSLSNSSVVLHPKECYELRKVIKAPDRVPQHQFEVVEIDIGRYSNDFRGKVILFFISNADNKTLGIKYSQRTLAFEPETTQDRVPIRHQFVIKDFGGNRITVGGFRMAFPKLTKLLRRGKVLIPAVYDIDVVPNSKVSFDVARTRIMDEKTVIRGLLRETIHKALEDMGIWGRLEVDIRKVFKAVVKAKDPFSLPPEKLKSFSSQISDEALLAKVNALLPKDEWPAHIHQSIAQSLGISNTLAFRAIATLIIGGRIKKPEKN